MPTPVSCTAISTSPPRARRTPTDTTASGPACSSALSSRLPSTTSSRRGATGTRRPRAATNRRSRLRQVRRARRSATTASAAAPASACSPVDDLAAVERREQQHLVDQAAHRVDLDLDLHDERLALGVGLRQLERLGQAEDARQRRAQLVRDGGREQAPGLAEVARRGHVDEHGERTVGLRAQVHLPPPPDRLLDGDLAVDDGGAAEHLLRPAAAAAPGSPVGEGGQRRAVRAMHVAGAVELRRRASAPPRAGPPARPASTAAPCAGTRPAQLLLEVRVARGARARSDDAAARSRRRSAAITSSSGHRSQDTSAASAVATASPVLYRPVSAHVSHSRAGPGTLTAWQACS